MNSYERKALKHIFTLFESQFNKSVILWEDEDYEAVVKEIKSSTGKLLSPMQLNFTVKEFIIDENTSKEVPAEMKEVLPIYFQKSTWEELVNYFAFEIHQSKKISFKDVPLSFWRAVLWMGALFISIYIIIHFLMPN